MGFANDKKINLSVCPLDSKEISTNWFDKNFPHSITENLPPPNVNTKKELNLSESIFTIALIIAVVYQASKNGKLNQDSKFEVPKAYEETIENLSYLSNYVIYSLNTLSLRGITQESHKEPVGIYGENLDVLIANLDKGERAKLLEYSYLIDWFDGFMTDEADLLKLKGYKLNRSKSKLYFTDKYLSKKNNIFSAENANEGILHVLFYLAVLISKRTPKFFAIDNIESCLNPHLCRHLMKEICVLAKDETIDKQLLITTHNPAILDGLNLFDDEIRLFEVKRLENGHTKTRRITIKPEVQNEMGGKYKLSELWTRGYLGAISQNF
ncbi:MAG: ATP-binding protein [Bacteroidetes bacterium]|nr:MAG: ATP-binding protein [Bacteroidota bacterium]